MPFWLLLGFIVGVANLIPMFGAWIGAIPVVLVSLATKPPAFLLVVLAVIAVAHVVDGYVLSPLVLKGATQLHPVVVLLVVLVGADLFGFWGVLAAIPVAGIVQLALRTWVLPRLQRARRASGAGFPGGRVSHGGGRAGVCRALKVLCTGRRTAISWGAEGGDLVGHLGAGRRRVYRGRTGQAA